LSDHDLSVSPNQETGPLAQILVRILQQAILQPSKLQSLIGEFQTIVWNSPIEEEAGDEWGVFSDLAYDLDFFEPDERIRQEDPVLFGEDRAIEEIMAALRRLGQSPIH
jgi:hypothetical protein